ncbi:RFC checkpoint protein Rad17 [Malassezia cuniculi]|uniref:RFC checkpoint protein Rad17 n=1 Tax=Malassezia cuniculi TaxID=948313 RepID=A0AAF0J5H0_9BASI|nr:RFC checkpoint protein Rad17 [Malassezia cuniculi]
MPPRKRRDTGANRDTRRLVFERRVSGSASASASGSASAITSASASGIQIGKRAPQSVSLPQPPSQPSLAELAVHKRKVGEVRGWLAEALGTSPVAKYRRLLALTGPAGCGKTATIHALAAKDELDYDITEWHAEAAFADGSERISHAERFEEFLRRATRFAALPLGGAKSRRRVVLVEDLPNISHGPTLTIFARALEHYVVHAARTPQVAVVLVISDAVPPVDSTDGWLQRREAALDIRTAVPPAVRRHPAFTEIRFNPATARMISGALGRIAGRGVPSATLSAIAESAHGDIRGAVNALAVASSKDAPQGRELTLALFHALGRILYNKRHGDPDDSNEAPRPPPASSHTPLPLGPWYPQLPDSRVDIEHLWASLPVDTDTLSLYLHHNYIPFTDDVDECAGILEALSMSDTLEGDASTGLVRSLYSFHMITRGVLLSLPCPVPRRAQRMTKPAAWEVASRRRAFQHELEDARAAATPPLPLSRIPIAEYASTVAPLVSRIQGEAQLWEERPNVAGTDDDEYEPISQTHSPQEPRKIPICNDHASPVPDTTEKTESDRLLDELEDLD